MEPAIAVSVIEREAASFASLLRPETLGRAVPGCPGWSIEDLARHLGGIHRWAGHIIRFGQSEPPAESVAPAELRGWFERGAADLVSTLRDCPPDEPCWTFGEPRTVRFWTRRQAHETALHRWDAAAALGDPVGIADELAVDGIDEVLTVFTPRQLRLGRCEAGPERVALRSTSGLSFALGLSADLGPSEPDAVVSGPAEVLLLLLWRRTTLADERLSLTGSWSAAQRLLDKALTP